MKVLIFLLLCMPYYHVMSQGSVSIPTHTLTPAPVPTPTPTPSSSPPTDSGCRFFNFSCPPGLTLTNRTFSQVEICAPIIGSSEVAASCRFVSTGRQGFICPNLYGLQRSILCIPPEPPETIDYCFCEGLPEIQLVGSLSLYLLKSQIKDALLQFQYLLLAKKDSMVDSFRSRLHEGSGLEDLNYDPIVKVNLLCTKFLQSEATSDCQFVNTLKTTGWCQVATRISGLPDIFFVGNASTLTEDDRVLTVCAVAGQLDPEFTPVNMTIATANGTATGGNDFVGVNQRFSFQSGQTQCVDVTIMRDSVYEGDKSFTLELTLEYAPFDIPLDTYSVTIIDSDIIGIGFEREVYVESGRNISVCVVTNVTLGGSLTASAVLLTQPVSAEASADYFPVFQTLVFRKDSGDRICVNITIINDLERNDFHEVFLVNLASTEDIRVFPDRAYVVVLEQDPFYPFGFEAGDSVLPAGAPPAEQTSSAGLTLAPPFRFFSRNENTLYVNTNGALSFNRPFTVPEPESFPLAADTLISPYWEFYSTRRFGHVYYRNTTDITLLGRAQYSLQDIFPSARNFSPSYLFIATWDGVPELGTNPGNPNLANTFQAVLATDGEKSFVYFTYMDIQWGNGSMGFNAGDGVRSFSLNGSATDEARMIVNGSNVNVVGQYAFRVDLQDIISPGECGGQAGVIRLFNGSTTSEGEVQYCSNSMWTPVCGDTWGENEAAVACRQLGFAGEGATVSLGELGGLTPLTTNFSCMGNESSLSQCCCLDNESNLSQCFSCMGNESNFSQCSSVARVNCNAVHIGFDQTSYTVAEGNESVTVCVNMSTGSANVLVSLQTIDIGSAQSKTDYIPTSAEFLFEGAPQQCCALINITDDDRIEPTESFLVILNTTRTSQTVSLNPQFVFVTITDDDDSVRIGFSQTSYTVAEGDESVTVCVNMTTGIATVPVSLETIDIGSAQAGTDYDATSDELLFLGAPQQLCVQINITDDGHIEPTESFLVMLNTTPSEFVSLNPQFISVFITDDDGVPLGAPAGAIAGSVFGGLAIGIIVTLLAGGIPLAVLWNWKKKSSHSLGSFQDLGTHNPAASDDQQELQERESSTSTPRPS